MSLSECEESNNNKMPTWKQMEMKGDDDSSSDDDRFSQTSDIPQNQSHLTINAAITSRENSVSDIVAVVLASPSRQEAPASKFASNKSPNYNLLLADASLPIGKCARMVVSVTSNNLASLLLGGTDANNIEGVIDLGVLQPGDVVRFNHVEVYKHHDDDSMGCSDNQPTDQTPPLLNIICDLRTSWKIPHAGPSFARICRILPESDVANTGQAFRLQWERNIAMSFETSRDIVTELAILYSRHYSKPDSLPKNENQECKKRSIRDITTTNQVSHVLVKVIRCERATTIFSTPCKSSTESRLVHATLSDGPGTDDVIGLSASVRHERVAGAQQVLPKGISTTLLQAMIEGSYVLITNLISQSINPVAVGKEYLGLQPTIETSASIITMNHPYYVPRLSQYGEDTYASQPLTLERASQLLSLTQQIDSPEKNNDTRGLIAIESPLRDIFVDGISASLVESCYWEKPRALSNFLIQRPSISTGLSAIKLQPFYRSATLLLDHNIVSREIVVNADGNALKLLCMDVPIEDMIVDDMHDASKHPYLFHVRRMLQSLCEENVLIRWVLEQEDERNFFVINATLLEI